MASEKIMVLQVKVKPNSGKNTRLQNFTKMVDGKPDIKPANPKVTKSKGTKLRVSTNHKLSTSDNGNAVVKGADGRSFYFVTNDVVNGDAAKLFVKETDVHIIGSGEIYTVKPKDSLTKISKNILGNTDFANSIYKANKSVIGNNSDLIQPGQKLFIPYNTH